MMPMNGGAPPILVIIVNRPQPPTIAASEPSTSMIGLSLNGMTNTPWRVSRKVEG